MDMKDFNEKIKRFLSLKDYAQSKYDFRLVIRNGLFYINNVQGGVNHVDAVSAKSLDEVEMFIRGYDIGYAGGKQEEI